MSKIDLSMSDYIGLHINQEPNISIEDFATRFSGSILKALSNDQIRHFLFACFTLGRIDIIEYFARVREGFAAISLSMSDQVHPDPSIITVTVTAERRLTFILSNTAYPFAASYPEIVQMVLWHFVQSLPLFVSYAKSDRLPGSTYLNVADDPHYCGLAFCNRDDLTSLLPDPYFMRSRAYRDLKARFSERQRDWKDRIDGAVWRGANTGAAIDNDILSLSRVKLCCYAKQYEPVLDCGITSIVQKFAEADEAALDRLGICKSYLPAEEFAGWKFQVDIDGMTSSWPGLFTKLLSRSVVLKVDSAKGWKQWYYDRLVPWKHYIPIRGDFSDLKPIVDFLIANPGSAEKIADESRRLMLAFTYEQEIAAAHGSIEKEFRRNLLG